MPACHCPTRLGLCSALLLALICPSAPAQAPADPALRFAQIRQAAVAADPALAQPARPGLPGDPTPLLDCLSAGLDLGVDDKDPEGGVIQIAMEVEQLGQSLRALAVPPAVWQPLLDTMQRGAIDALTRLAQRGGSAAADQALNQRHTQLKEQLEQAVIRHQRQRRGPPVVLQEGCGAGELPVELSTRPPGGQVSYITLFRHRLCEVQRIVPTDRQRCRGWVDAVKKQEFLSGQYAYQVRWPDGQRSSGVFDTRPAAMADGQGEDVVRIQLRR
ncbi:hypothetical protein KAK06_07090 [Ideonella sp. 4Y11]|uniref:Uncharacterized protein n=1 Tax=Ideonella aquatica TaxID=2824119 RepID=A0A941BIM4_9BURK|nr:hypothetical protein [Ideonella aquatica]MBQ0958722.1 hypothetical protein [Ideonella aquatica]